MKNEVVVENCKNRNIEIHCEISRYCLLNCIHCSSMALKSNIDVELNKFESDEIIEFINKLYPIKHLYFVLTGGEPFLLKRDLLLKICGSINKLPMEKDIGFFSSGCVWSEKAGSINFIEEEFIKELKENGVTFIYISLFSHLSTIHDFVTKTNGSHSFSVKTIENLKKQGISVKVNLVLMKINIHKINETIDFLSALGVDEIRLLRLVNHGRAVDNWRNIGLTDSEQIRVINEIMLNNQRIKITIGGFPHISSCQSFVEKNMCVAGENKFYIDTDGLIFPCACMKNSSEYCLGNLKKFDKDKFTKNKVSSQLCLQDSINIKLFNDNIVQL